MFGEANPPQSLKSLSYFFKLAEDHEAKYVPISYWCCIYALKCGLQINKKEENKDTTAYLYKIIKWLEDVKKEHANEKAITDDEEAANFINSFISKYFTYAERKENAGVCDKTVSKAYYNAATLIEILSEFGPISEELLEKQKYARYKAALIHKSAKLDQDSFLNTNQSSNNENTDDSIGIGFENLTPNLPPTLPETPRKFSGPNIKTTDFDSPKISPPAPPATPVKPNNMDYPLIPGLSHKSFGEDDASKIYEALQPERLKEAKKMCKYAESALNFEDIKTAVENLEKALNILKNVDSEDQSII